MTDLRVYTLPAGEYADRVMLSIGPNIQRLRIAAGYQTQKAFAEAVGVPQPRMSDWENGRYKGLKIENLLRIAKVLRVSVDALLVGSDAGYDALAHDLACHATGVTSAFSSPEVVDASSAARVLTPVHRHNKLLAQELQEILSRLGRIATDLAEEVAATRPTSAGRGRRHRKTG